MTDDTGIIQHATFSVPARESGYCVDDNARALIVALHADRLNGSRETKRLVSTYLGFLHVAQTADGRFRNFMSYSRSFVAETASEDCTGRALWALGMAVHLAGDEGQRLLARQMFERGLAFATELGPRGTALTMLGLASFLTARPEVSAGRRAARAALAATVPSIPATEATPDWRWFEPTLTYDNALLPLALLRAHADHEGPGQPRGRAGERSSSSKQTCFRDDRLVLIGNAGWHSRSGARADADEQPIDAAAFVLAFRGAYLATGDHRYLRRMREAFAWFLGRQPPGGDRLRLGHRGVPGRTGRDGAEPEPGRREHGLLPAVADRDAGAGRRRSRVRRRARRRRMIAAMISDLPRPAARPEPRHRQAIPARRGDRRRRRRQPRGPAHDAYPRAPGGGSGRRAGAGARSDSARVTSRFEELLERHFALVAHRVGGVALSRERRLLIGAYFTNEYSVEGAALFNPSLVLAPDQSGTAPGERRFVMSLRAVGEGHISSIEFRTGVIDASSAITFDPLGPLPGDRRPRAALRTTTRRNSRQAGRARRRKRARLGGSRPAAGTFHAAPSWSSRSPSWSATARRTPSASRRRRSCACSRRRATSPRSPPIRRCPSG